MLDNMSIVHDSEIVVSLSPNTYTLRQHSSNQLECDPLFV